MPGEGKTSGNKGAGAKEVRDEPLEIQRSMGNVRRSNSHKYHDRGVQAKIQVNPRTIISTSSFVGTFPRHNSQVERVHPSVDKKGHNTGNIRTNPPIFFKNFHETKEKREIKTNNRPVTFKSTSRIPIIQNGNSVCNSSVYFRRALGLFSGHSGRLFSCPNGLGVPQIPGFQSREQDICLSVPAFRPVSSSLGIHESHQACQDEASSMVHSDLQLPRRLHNVCHISGAAQISDKDSARPASKPGLHHQLGEVIVNPSSGSGIPRSPMGPEDGHPVCPPGQKGADCSTLHRVDVHVSSHTSSVGRPCGTVELRGTLHPTRENEATSHHSLDEPQDLIREERHPGEPFRKVQVPLQGMDLPGISKSVRSSTRTGSSNFSDDRCVSGWVVRSSTAPQDCGHLASRMVSAFHELEGVEGDPLVPAEVRTPVDGEDSPGVVRQHNSSELFEKARNSEISVLECPHINDFGVLQGEGDHLDSTSSPGSDERSGRPGVEAETSRDGVDARPEDLRIHSSKVPRVASRPFCNPVQQPTANVCVSLPGRRRSGLRRLRPRLESLGPDLPFSTQGSHSSGCSTADNIQGLGGNDSSILAESGMVPITAEEMCQSNSPSRGPHSVPVDTGGPSVGRNVLLEPSRLATLIKCYEQVEASEGTLDIVKRAHAESSIRQYQSIWTKFLNFLEINNICHEQISIVNVLNFLSFHSINKNKSYRTIAAYKCAIELPLKLLLGLDFECQELSIFMKGLFNRKPPQKCAPMPRWYLDILFSYLNSSKFEPLGLKAITVVQQKLLVLMLLATGRRIDEVAHFSLKIDCDSENSQVRLSWLDGYSPKHYTSNFMPKMPVIEALDSNVPGDILLCPRRALLTFVEMRKDSVNHPSNKHPLWLDSTDVLSKLFSSIVVRARESAQRRDTVPIGPHQMRKLAASYSAKMLNDNKAMETLLLERMGYKSMKIIKKCYIAHVPDLNYKCVVPLGTYNPL